LKRESSESSFAGQFAVKYKTETVSWTKKKSQEDTGQTSAEYFCLTKVITKQLLKKNKQPDNCQDKSAKMPGLVTQY
jgi:hypothetical protein